MALFEFVQALKESSSRTPHPEDFIFGGSDRANTAIDSLIEVVNNPQSITIKWDGYPAIVFGRRPNDGKFTMNYKEYIGQPGGQPSTAQELLDFYVKNNKNIEVGRKLANVFNAIGSVCPTTFKGFVQGDLMWTDALQPQGGHYVFKPNPHGVTYKVPEQGLGEKINGRQVGIAVHTISEDTAGGKRSMNGLEGLTDGSQWCTVFTGNMGNKFKVNRPVKVENTARSAVNTFKSVGGDDFLTNLTGSTKSALQTYYNRKATNQPVDSTWLQTKLSRPQFEIVNSEDNKPILVALDAVYAGISALKLAILQQLEPQVHGIEQFVGDIPKGEGFNIDSPNGFIKLVNRGVFSTANFAGRA